MKAILSLSPRTTLASAPLSALASLRITASGVFSPCARLPTWLRARSTICAFERSSSLTSSASGAISRGNAPVHRVRLALAHLLDRLAEQPDRPQRDAARRCALMIASMTPTADSTISVWPRNSSTKREDLVEAAGDRDAERRAVPPSPAARPSGCACRTGRRAPRCASCWRRRRPSISGSTLPASEPERLTTSPASFADHPVPARPRPLEARVAERRPLRCRALRHRASARPATRDRNSSVSERVLSSARE